MDPREQRSKLLQKYKLRENTSTHLTPSFVHRVSAIRPLTGALKSANSLSLTAYGFQNAIYKKFDESLEIEQPKIKTVYEILEARTSFGVPNYR